MPKNKTIAAAFILLFLSMPLASALDMGDVGLGELLNEIGKLIDKIRQEPEAQLGIIFIMFFIIFYAVLNSALKRVKLFEGEGGIGLSKPGHMVALSIAGLMCFSIFFVKEPTQNLINRILNPFGVFGGAILAGGVFALVTLGFKDEKVMGMDPKMFGFMAAGIALLAVGGMLNLNSMYGWGWFLTLGTLILWGISGLASRWAAGREDSAGKREKETEDEIREQQIEKGRLDKMNKDEPKLLAAFPKISEEIQNQQGMERGKLALIEEVRKRIGNISRLQASLRQTKAGRQQVYEGENKEKLLGEILAAGNGLRQLYAITTQVEERERNLKKYFSSLESFIKNGNKKMLDLSRRMVSLEEKAKKESDKEVSLKARIDDLKGQLEKYPDLKPAQKELSLKEAQLAKLSVETIKEELRKKKEERDTEADIVRAAHGLKDFITQILNLEKSMKSDTDRSYKELTRAYKAVTESIENSGNELKSALRSLDKKLIDLSDKIHNKYEPMAEELVRKLAQLAGLEQATQNLRQQIEALMDREFQILMQKVKVEQQQAQSSP